MISRKFFAIIIAGILLSSGCGYTTQSLLPTNYKTIFIPPFKNGIKVEAEQSNMRMYRGYRPGMEIELTKSVINRFISDGNLEVYKESSSDLLLIGELIDYRREPLRYDSNDNIEEYRIKIVVNIELQEGATGKTVWKEEGFAGETTYKTTGSNAKSDSAAVKDAMEDISRRIVERAVEAW